MVTNANEPVSVPAYRGIDRVLGVLLAASSLMAGILVALAISDLDGGRLNRAIELALAALVVRALAQLLVDQVVVAQERELRAMWHERAVSQLARSTVAQLHTLDVAVDRLAAQPTLDVSAAAAAGSLVALAILYVAAGWLPTLIVVALIAASIPAYIQVGRASVALMEDFHRRRTTLVARQLAILRAITDLRALGAVRHGADEIAAATDAENRAVIAGVRVTIRSTLVTEFLGGVSVGLVAMVVGIRLWHHQIALSNALIAVLVTAEMFAWLRRYGSEFHRRDDAEHARTQLAGWRGPDAPRDQVDLIRAIEVLTVAPCAPVSLSVGPGERVRITGPSGSGKTSLIETVLGLREPLGGQATRSLARIGFIRADGHFLDGSLRENATLGEPVDDARLRAVLDEVGLSGERFADLDSPLSENARMLSSGERVKLALARALIADAQLLVVDDVAGVLDESSRRLLNAALTGHPEIAVLEAAHDVAVVASPDRVVELRIA